MGNYYAGMMNNTGGYGELKHHGILGQKWGVRRWQNDDGSLTAAGKKRYNKGSKITRNYFESIGEPESIEKYQRLSRKEQKIVDKGVKDLRGPNEFWRGNYEVAFKKSILPPFKRIGEKMTDARLARGRDALAKTIYNEPSENVPKSGMPKVSLRNRISNFYNGRTSGETDSTKVKDLTLRRQMENNQRKNVLLLQDKKWFGSDEAKEEKALTDKFIKTSLKKFDNSPKYDKNTWKKGKVDAQKYMREVAKIRLKSMGYDVNDKAIDNLVSKKWFRESLWIRNGLAYMGGIPHSESSGYDDYRP